MSSIPQTDVYKNESSEKESSMVLRAYNPHGGGRDTLILRACWPVRDLVSK